MIPLPDFDTFPHVPFAAFDWLRKQGVLTETLIALMPVREAAGVVAYDGRFDAAPDGKKFIVFEEPEDAVFWQPISGELATWNGRAFALGQDNIDNPGTYSFDCALNVFADPLDWLRNKCDGCVVLDWSRAFDRLRDCPRIVIDERLLFQYRRHMKPAHMPALSVRTVRKAVAA